MTGLTGPIKRTVEINGDTYRVEVSPFGVALYRHRGRKAVYEISWERMAALGQRSGKSSGKQRGPDPWIHIQRVYVELDALAADMRQIKERLQI